MVVEERAGRVAKHDATVEADLHQRAEYAANSASCWVVATVRKYYNTLSLTAH